MDMLNRLVRLVKASDDSGLPLDDKSCKDIQFRRQQPRRPAAPRSPRRRAPARAPSRPPTPRSAGYVLLCKVEIAARGLPEPVGRRRHVEHVVGDLKREADRLAERRRARRARRRRRRAASPPSATDARISAPVLARWIRSSSARLERAVLALEIEQLPADHSAGARRAHELATIAAAGACRQVRARAARERRAAPPAGPSRRRPPWRRERRTRDAPSGARDACRRRPCTADRRGRANTRARPRSRRRARSRRVAPPAVRYAREKEQAAQAFSAAEEAVANRVADARLDAVGEIDRTARRARDRWQRDRPPSRRAGDAHSRVSTMSNVPSARSTSRCTRASALDSSSAAARRFSMPSSNSASARASSSRRPRAPRRSPRVARGAPRTSLRRSIGAPHLRRHDAVAHDQVEWHVRRRNALVDAQRRAVGVARDRVAARQRRERDSVRGAGRRRACIDAAGARPDVGARGGDVPSEMAQRDRRRCRACARVDAGHAQ